MEPETLVTIWSAEIREEQRAPTSDSTVVVVVVVLQRSTGSVSPEPTVV